MGKGGRATSEALMHIETKLLRFAPAAGPREDDRIVRAWDRAARMGPHARKPAQTAMTGARPQRVLALDRPRIESE